MLGGSMGSLPSVMNHDFSRVPQADIQRSTFRRSHGLKTTFDAGYLVPIYVDEVLPGDSFSMNAHGFGRLATPIFPVMDNLYIETFFFFVPNRLIWNNWEKFMGQQDNPDDSIDYLIPQVTGATVAAESLQDYFGLPTGVAGLAYNNLHGRAYNLIWNEWFRDQNLQDSVVVDKDDGPDTQTDYVLLKRGKRHDYFTSCLPWPQKGEAVTIPIGEKASLVSADYDVYSGKYIAGTIGTAGGAPSGSLGAYTWPTTGDSAMYADLTSATASTINDLREAFQIQRLYEKFARSGSRYTEIIQSHFGVTSPDSRLQRPEYLGGGKSNISMQPIPQTSSTDATTPQGNLSAIGTSSVDGHGFSKSFTEHGVLIGLACVFADLTYQQGINRMWSRRDRFDYYWPTLSHLGEQAVYNREIYAQGTATDDAVFGYQERYAEYRYKPSQVTSQMRSNYAQSLDAWHLSLDFASLPALNSSFIEENPPIDRVVAVPTAPDFIFDWYFDLKSTRPMPTYSVPGLIDHF
jgi:hypothetical protein